MSTARKVYATTSKYPTICVMCEKRIPAAHKFVSTPNGHPVCASCIDELTEAAKDIRNA